MVRVPAHTGFKPICVIAGAGPGLGAAIAERYSSEGFISYMLSRRPKRVAGAVAPLLARGLSVVPLKCDVRSAASVGNAIDFIGRTGGGCDVVVFNAFVDSAKRAMSLGSEQLLSDFRVNVASALSLVRLAVRHMRLKGTGTILFSGCGLAHAPSARKTSLSVSKAGLRALVDCLAEELEPRGVRVGMVTIEGAVPVGAARLASIADLYWHLFVDGRNVSKREVRWPKDALPARSRSVSNTR